jgi:hypothetical protein
MHEVAERDGQAAGRGHDSLTARAEPSGTEPCSSAPG